MYHNWVTPDKTTNDVRIGRSYGRVESTLLQCLKNCFHSLIDVALASVKSTQIDTKQSLTI